ncbi:acyltransferase family protein [Methylobacter sp. YRD-M1]|uniref:acyltransferase family protein n=1 Tax=Methylobacter sp. YRD-M1 TaxID=2911520 RepID=UPI00227CE311|nr:acyltransferase [Methylobacter sp. YRD-M1]WAK02631.1 acyltransferase [Methylobacter sp. YRD-M1]
MHLNSFDYFRGLAIMFVVAGHSCVYWGMDTFYEKVFANLIMGGTTFFVFISGFFFHHVFYSDFNYKRFIFKKAEYVLLPYTILSIMGILCFVFYLDRPPYAEIFVTDQLNSWHQYMKLSIQYWWTGSILDAYWYIPFIMIIFALSPLFIKLIQLSVRIQAGLLIFLLCISSLIHRPAHNLSHLHSVIYFIPVYMLGIICSIEKVRVLKFLEGKSIILGCLIILISAAQILIYDRYGNFHKETMFSYEGIDLMIIQKILMCFFLLSVTQKFENKDMPFLRYIATASFAIYFLHPWILYFLDYLSVFQRFNFLPGVLGFAITVPFVIAISLFIAILLKRVSFNNSRFIVGW